jgi:hypothetical protein
MRALLASGCRSARWTVGLFLVGLTGCIFGKPPVATVPIKATAVEQYKFASDQQARTNLPLILDKTRYREQREVLRQVYQKVIDNFPADRVFTPLAKLDVIEIGLGLSDSPTVRIIPSASQVHQAIEQVKAVAKDYPEYEFIQAKSLYLEGMYHKFLGEYPQAQPCFKEVMDKFANSKDKSIGLIVLNAKKAYDQVYVSK